MKQKINIAEILKNKSQGIKLCKYQVNNGWCKARGDVCIWSEYTESCLKREEV